MEVKIALMVIGMVLFSRVTYAYVDNEKYIKQTKEYLSQTRENYFGIYSLRLIFMAIGTGLILVPFLMIVVYYATVLTVVSYTLMVAHVFREWHLMINKINYFSKHIDNT